LREGGRRVEIRSLLGANEGFVLASLKSSSDTRDGERWREIEKERKREREREREREKERERELFSVG